jgi:hypothetical protein
MAHGNVYRRLRRVERFLALARALGIRDRIRNRGGRIASGKRRFDRLVERLLTRVLFVDGLPSNRRTRASPFEHATVAYEIDAKLRVSNVRLTGASVVNALESPAGAEVDVNETICGYGCRLMRDMRSLRSRRAFSVAMASGSLLK